MHRTSVRLSLLLAACLLPTSLSACGDDDSGDDDTSSTDSGTRDAAQEPDAGSEEDAATSAMDAGEDSSTDEGGGSGGTGGTGGTGGMMAVDAGDPYQCEPPENTLTGTISAGNACCDGLGVCEQSDDMNSGVGDCSADDGLRCTPVEGDDADAGAAADALASCRMQLPNAAADDPDFEGRCVPECLTRGIENLTQADCEDGERCVPCYSPINGEDTGACRRSGDAPVDDPIDGFAACGDAAGYCVPTSVAGSRGATLMQLDCAEGEVCAPKSAVETPGACFAHCESGFGPGACVATFLVPAESQMLLMAADCAEGELCAPCVNPIDQMRTGACD